MKRLSLYICLLASLCLLMAGCKKEDDKPKFSSVDLIGKWRSGTEYWRYDKGGTGKTWDEADDVYEDDETTMRFSWVLDGDQLQHTFSGDEVHQAVIQDYTILELTSTKLRWDNGLKTVTFTKVQ